MRIEIQLHSLWAEHGGGWSSNDIYRRSEIDLPDSASDLAIARAVLREFSGYGFRRDTWCNADFAWRSGTYGLTADILPGD